jgi:hypothetical protein
MMKTMIVIMKRRKPMKRKRGRKKRKMNRKLKIVRKMMLKFWKNSRKRWKNLIFKAFFDDR